MEMVKQKIFKGGEKMDWGVILEMAVGIAAIIIFFIGIFMAYMPANCLKKENRYNDIKLKKVRRLGIIIVIVTLIGLFFIFK